MVERGVEVSVVTNVRWKMHICRGLHVIYLGLPYILVCHYTAVHCTTFWISTWATRHVSFKEESRMIGQSLRWEVF